jgi:hypothetical protein
LKQQGVEMQDTTHNIPEATTGSREESYTFLEYPEKDDNNNRSHETTPGCKYVVQTFRRVTRYSKISTMTRRLRIKNE